MRDILVGMCEGLFFVALLYGTALAYCVAP